MYLYILGNRMGAYSLMRDLVLSWNLYSYITKHRTGKTEKSVHVSLPPDSLPTNLTMAEKCLSILSSLHGKRPSFRKAFSEITFDCCENTFPSTVCLLHTNEFCSESAFGVQSVPKFWLTWWLRQ